MTQKDKVLNFLKENGLVNTKDDFQRFSQKHPEVSRSNFRWYRNDLIKKGIIQNVTKKISNDNDINILKTQLRFKNKTNVTIQEIEKLANDLLSITWNFDFMPNTNLSKKGWKFRFGTYKRANGKCVRKGSIKEISLSKYIITNNLDKPNLIENTLRHELAHALDYEYRNKSDHSRTWKMISKLVLSDGERCTSGYDKNITTSKYILYCPDCGCSIPSHRKIKKNAKSYKCCLNCYNSTNKYVRLLQKAN